MDEHYAAVRVCELLVHLRKVFFEHAIYAKGNFDLPIYKHSVFTHPKWQQYVLDESAQIQQRQQALERDQPDYMLRTLYERLVPASGHNMMTSDNTKVTTINTVVSAGDTPIDDIFIGIFNPSKLAVAYKDWTDNWRDVGTPLWKDEYGDQQFKYKSRYFVVKDAYKYMDRCINSGMTEADVINKMHNAAKELKITLHLFITRELKFFFSPNKREDVQRKACKSVDELKDVLKKVGLPSV